MLDEHLDVCLECNCYSSMPVERRNIDFALVLMGRMVVENVLLLKSP